MLIHRNEVAHGSGRGVLVHASNQHSIIFTRSIVNEGNSSSPVSAPLPQHLQPFSCPARPARLLAVAWRLLAPIQPRLLIVSTAPSQVTDNDGGDGRLTRLITLRVVLQVGDKVVKVLLLALAVLEGLALELGVVSLVDGSVDGPGAVAKTVTDQEQLFFCWRHVVHQGWTTDAEGAAAGGVLVYDTI